MAKSKLFRENYERSIHLAGTIDQTTLDRLTPQIQRLRSDAPEAITVYIDSRGGLTRSAEMLRRLIKSPTQDGLVCRIITVVTNFAGSAAADFLAAGDYAIAYPSSMILYHGVRQRSNEAVTTESAQEMAESLKKSSEDFALQLADRCIDRFVFNSAANRSEYSEIRNSTPDGADLSDLECLKISLQKRAPDYHDLFDKALSKRTMNAALTTHVNKELSKRKSLAKGPVRLAVIEAAVLESVLHYELKRNQDPNWSIGEDGFSRIKEDFALLRDYRSPRHQSKMKSLVEKYGRFFLTDDETQTYNDTQEDQRPEWLLNTTRERMHDLWYFFVSICRLLQEGENYMTPTEAYWFGLINEVVGSKLPCLREAVESALTDTSQNEEAPATDGATS